MALTVDGADVGRVWITEKLTESGGKVGQFKMQLIKGPQSVTIIEEAEYNKDARPVRKTFSQEGAGSRVATFSAGVVTVVMEAEGQTETKAIPIPTSADVRAQSEFWFLRDKPKPGAKSIYHRFDMKELAWVKTQVAYVGSGTLKIRGKAVKAHLTKSGPGKAWVDDHGRPLRIEAGKLVMLRDG
ncbi:MAG: hypothetical protein ACR2HJ_13110 [Fimbriimonadales bacterium]